MPTFDVTSPDGKKFRVTAPEGATQEQIIAYAQQNMPKPAEDKYTRTAQEDGVLDNLAASFGGVVAGIPLGVRAAFGADKPGEVRDWKESMAGLWSTPGGKVGTVAGGLATIVPALAIPGANTAAGAAAIGGVSGMIQPAESWKERGINTVLGGALGGGTQAVVNKVAGAVAAGNAAKATELAKQESQNAVRDGAVKAAQEAGYVIPPSQVAPSVPNRLLEGFAGKLTTAQQASAKNQSVTNRLVRKDLGLPEDAPLSRDTLAALRSEASNKGYVPLAEFGTISADKEYAKAMMELATKYDRSHGGMKSLRNPEVEGIIKDASQMQFDSKNVIEFLRNLREQGFANKAPVNDARTRALGSTQIDIARAIEDLTERNLARAGQAELLQNFRDARRLIAKSFTAEKAINPATGNIDASKIGAMFKKGKPLDEGMREVGRASAAFPAATKEVTTSMPGLSPLDYMGGVLTGSAAGPAGLAAAFARPVVRSGILSGPYQKAMVNAPSYDLPTLRKKLPDLLESPLLGLLGASQVPTLFGRP